MKFNDGLIFCTEHGVLQGFVLGPLLFIIYLNNIIKICPDKYNIKTFADDTLIYVNGDRNKELKCKMNMALNRTMDVRFNKLKMDKKTKC